MRDGYIVCEKPSALKKRIKNSLGSVFEFSPLYIGFYLD